MLNIAVITDVKGNSKIKKEQADNSNVTPIKYTNSRKIHKIYY